MNLITKVISGNYFPEVEEDVDAKDPVISAELQHAIADGGLPALELVLAHALKTNDLRVIAYCTRVLNAMGQRNDFL